MNSSPRRQPIKILPIQIVRHPLVHAATLPSSPNNLRRIRKVRRLVGSRGMISLNLCRFCPSMGMANGGGLSHSMVESLRIIIRYFIVVVSIPSLVSQFPLAAA